MRALILEADPEMTEEWKWRGTPVWSHHGIVCTGEAYTKVVKLTSAGGPGSQTHRASSIPAWRATREGRSTSTVDAGAFKALVKAAVAQNGSPAKTLAPRVRGGDDHAPGEAALEAVALTKVYRMGHDPAALEIVVDVLTTDAVGLRPGAPVRIERWGGDSVLRGHVHRVEPAAFTRLSAVGVEEQRVNVVVDLEGSREAHAMLGDGFPVEVTIVVWSGGGRLIMPGGGVHRHAEGGATYVVEDGRARLRAVRLGRRNAEEAEVLDGLRPGERVVLYPTDNVRDGVRVEER